MVKMKATGDNDTNITMARAEISFCVALGFLGFQW